MALIKHPDKSNFWEKAFILANSVKGQSPVAGIRGGRNLSTRYICSQETDYDELGCAAASFLLERFRTQGQGMAPSR